MNLSSRSRHNMFFKVLAMILAFSVFSSVWALSGYSADNVTASGTATPGTTVPGTATAGATSTTPKTSSGSIIDIHDSVTSSGTGWTFSGGVFTITGDVTIAGEWDDTVLPKVTTNRIVVESGANVAIRLINAYIDLEADGGCAFDIRSGAAVSLIFEGYNVLKSGSGFAGLQVPVGASLTIDAAGTLDKDGYPDELTASGGKSGAGYGAGIGGNVGDGGNITINSGIIRTSGGSYSAGIGGGNGGNGGTITINGGEISARSAGAGAGIGGGGYGDGGTIIINGGIVTAEGSGNGAGIGGGLEGTGGSITINNGTIDAQGGIGSMGGAGIGGGDGRTGNTSTSGCGVGGDIAIHGGVIIAKGGCGAGIGGGNFSKGGNTYIDGGTIIAIGGLSAGIGGGYAGTGGNITIAGGTINASSNYGGAGIGNGIRARDTARDMTPDLGRSGAENDLSIAITGGDVTAEGCAGIGSSSGESLSGTITISDGKVHASVPDGTGAGIGSGGSGNSSGSITISGGDIYAEGGSSSTGGGAGIGGASGGNGGTVTISGGNITAKGGYKSAAIGGGSDSNGNYGKLILKNLENTIIDPIAGDGASAAIGDGAGSSGTGTIESELLFTGPTGMTLSKGYSDTFTRSYTILGFPTPTVSQDKNYGGKIVWNNAEKRFDISAGLAAGSYPVKLTVSNGVEPNAEFTFTLTVSNNSFPPSISGSDSMTLSAGYSDTFTGSYTISGSPTPTVSQGKNYGGKIVWNNTEKRFDIKAGLAAGSYPVKLTVSNGVEPNAEFTFTLTVSNGTTAPPEDQQTNGGPSTSGSKSGSSSGTSSGSTRTVSGNHFESKEYITEANLQAAIKQAKDSGSGSVKTRAAYSGGHTLIKPQALALMAGYSYIHDTTGSPVQVRVKIPEPAKMKSTVHLCGTVSGVEVDKTKARFEKLSGNDIRAIELHQKGSWGQAVIIAARVDFKDMDTRNLYFYSYDSETNKYKNFATKYKMDNNGYIHFTTTLSGTIVISDGPLKKTPIGEISNPAIGNSEITDMSNTFINENETVDLHNPSTGDDSISSLQSTETGDDSVSGLQNTETGDDSVSGLQNTETGDDSVYSLQVMSTDGGHIATAIPDPLPVESKTKILIIIWLTAAILILIACLWAFIPRKNDEYV